MNLANTIAQAVNLAKQQIGDIGVDFTLRKKVSQQHVAGKIYVDYENFVIRGVHTKFDDNEVDGMMVKMTDVKLLLFVDGTIPVYGDKLMDGATEYEVVKVSNTMAGVKTVLSTIVVRK